MSAHGMKPGFNDEAGYRAWRSQWRSLYRRLSGTIRKHKAEVRAQQRAGIACGKQQKNLLHERVMAHKLMGLLTEARERWRRILAMREQIAAQNAHFPLDLGHCKTIDFHFNKGSLDYPDLPMWIIKAKGQTFYIQHMDADAPWSTRELDAGSTRGMLRFRNCSLSIDATGEAHITRTEEIALAQVA